MANRWLPAYEEADLGFRLRSKGWHLLRIPDVAVVHSGHDESNLVMLKRLWRNKRAHASGMFIRSAIGKKWLIRVALSQWFVFVTLVAHAFAILVATLFANDVMQWGLTFLSMELALWSLAFLALLVKKRDLWLAALAILNWQVFSMAAILGFLEGSKNPLETIDARVIKDIGESLVTSAES